MLATAVVAFLMILSRSQKILIKISLAVRAYRHVRDLYTNKNQLDYSLYNPREQP
jgi:hypothetical protein